MELALLLIIGVLIVSILWNHWNQRQAAEGVSFDVPLPPEKVDRILRSLYCDGAKAKARSAVFRVFVRQSMPGRFEVTTRIGDQGSISVTGEVGGSSRVTAQIHRVHVGSHPMKVSGRSSYWGLATRLENLYRLVFHLSTYAGRLNRFQKGVQRKVIRLAAAGAQA